MARRLTAFPRREVPWYLRVLLIASFLLVGQFAFPHQALAAVIASDSFNRADGGLGANWTATSDGAMSIASQQVTGRRGEHRGDPDGGVVPERSVLPDRGEPDAADRRASGSGRRCGCRPAGRTGTLGIYYWNYGSPELMLFKRNGGNWTQLGSAYNSGALPAGTQLQVTAVGSTISFLENGVREDHGHRQHANRRRAGDHGLRQRRRRIPGPAAARAGARRTRWAGRCRGCPGRWCCRTTAVTTLSVSANGPFTFAHPAGRRRRPTP